MTGIRAWVPSIQSVYFLSKLSKTTQILRMVENMMVRNNLLCIIYLFQVSWRCENQAFFKNQSKMKDFRHSSANILGSFCGYSLRIVLGDVFK